MESVYVLRRVLRSSIQKKKMEKKTSRTTLAPVGLQMALANRCILEFDNELLKMSGSVANIIRLAQNEQTRYC